MGTILTGRPLSETGVPTDGPGLELDEDGRAAALLADSPHALASSPGAGLWSAMLADPAGDTGTDPEMLVWVEPDGLAPPTHVHRTSPETFEAVEGTLTVVVEGDRQRLEPGESVTVPAGTEHTFANDSDETVAFRAETPWSKTIETQFTFCGYDHDGVFAREGYAEPDFLQGVLVADAIREETRITAAPQAVQRALGATVGQLGRYAGRRAVEERYLRDEHWEATVEQPDI